jgi:hypothetical protein
MRSQCHSSIRQLISDGKMTHVKRPWGWIPEEARKAMEGGAFLHVREIDEHDQEHLELVTHHPGFIDALERLREDLEAADHDTFGREMAVELARYPLHEVAPVLGFRKHVIVDSDLFADVVENLPRVVGVLRRSHGGLLCRSCNC